MYINPYPAISVRISEIYGLTTNIKVMYMLIDKKQIIILPLEKSTNEVFIPK